MKTTLFCALGLALLAGCGTPPREQFYTLNAPSLVSGKAGKTVLVVAQVTVPELVDRPQLVLHEGANQITLLEQQRWAAPLAATLSQALAGQLQAQLPQWQVALRQQHAHPEAKWSLWLDVQSFELRTKQGTQLTASWSLRTLDGKRVHNAQTSVEQPCPSCEPSALVAAQERAVAQLARDIAQQAQSLEAQP